MVKVKDRLDRVAQQLSTWRNLSLKIFAQYQPCEDQLLNQRDEMSLVNEVCV